MGQVDPMLNHRIDSVILITRGQNPIEITKVVFNSSLNREKTIGLIPIDPLIKVLTNNFKINHFNKLNL
jgi:hypothetical protein